jgi:uncharacterized alkaline shock family protein YloU
VAIRPTPGRSLVTGRALRDVVRTATLGSYGVTGLAGGPVGRLIERLGLATPGLSVAVHDGIEVELDITVALGVPIAEVARQVDSAIRYAVRQAIDREVGRITIHVDGLHVPAGGALPQSPTALPVERIRPRDLADSGTDVA